MKVVIQAGHVNCQNNVIASMRKNTGAPGEQELNKRIADRVSAMLRERGFEVVQTDACANSDPNITKKDYDLFLALHGDADAPNDKGGGMVGSGDKSVDMSWKRSAEIASIIKGVYFKETDIVDKNYVTEGMTKYYMWQYLTAKTPCVLLEMGQVQDPHDKVLLANTTLIASAIVRSLCKVFNIPYDLPNTTIDPKDQEIERLKQELNKAQASLIQAESKFKDDMAVKTTECQGLKDRLKQIALLSTL